MAVVLLVCDFDATFYLKLKQMQSLVERLKLNGQIWIGKGKGSLA